MSHSLLCLLPCAATTDLKAALTAHLSPFGVNSRERRIYLSQEEGYSVATHYQDLEGQPNPYLDPERTLPYGEAQDGISAHNISLKQRGALSPLFLAALASRLQDWYGHPGGCDSRGGVYYRLDENPDARWSSWAIGGAYDGQLYDETLTTRLWDGEGESSTNMSQGRNMRRASEVRFIPEALLTPDGLWHEPVLCLNNNSDGQEDDAPPWTKTSDSTEWHEHCRYLMGRFDLYCAVLLDYTP